MPAFEADVDDKAASTLRLVMHWQYYTISRGGSSIFEQLVAQGIRPADYITFYGLRTWDLLRDKRWYPQPSREELQMMQNTAQDDKRIDDFRRHHQFHEFMPNWLANVIDDKFFKKDVQTVEPEGAAKTEAIQDLERNALFISELLYIHTKVMIVDDRYVICGSANLNDRSMCGDRDSEIALYVEDTETVDIMMNGRPYKASRIAHDLRTRIFTEHLGLMPETTQRLLCRLPPHQKPAEPRDSDPYMIKIRELVSDPLSPQFFNLWAGTANRNTVIYRNMFRSVPDDTVTTWDDYHKFVVDKKKVLPGHVVNTSMDRRMIQEELYKLQGHLVEFPTAFLLNEKLKAAKWSAESVMPEEVFT